MLTGEKRSVTDPVVLFETASGENGTTSGTDYNNIETFKSVTAMSNILGFQMVEPLNSTRYTPVEYKIIDETVGVGIYEDLNGNSVEIRKAEGDFMNTQRNVSVKVKEQLFENSLVEVFEDNDVYVACFAIAKDSAIYSYSIEMSSKDMIEILAMCEDIIKRENK